MEEEIFIKKNQRRISISLFLIVDIFDSQCLRQTLIVAARRLLERRKLERRFLERHLLEEHIKTTLVRSIVKGRH